MRLEIVSPGEGCRDSGLWVVGPTNPQMSHPQQGVGGGGLLDTLQPTHPPNDHRQNALTSAFGADRKSPTMAYPTRERGGGGKQWVRFASPQSAPTAPAPRSSLLSVQCNGSLFSALAVRVFNGWG